MKKVSPLDGSSTTAGSRGGSRCARTYRSTVSSSQPRPMREGALPPSWSGAPGPGPAGPLAPWALPQTNSESSAAAASACFSCSESAVSCSPTGTSRCNTSCSAAMNDTGLVVSPSQIGPNSGHGAPSIGRPTRTTSLRGPPASARSRMQGGRSSPETGMQTISSGLKLSIARSETAEFCIVMKLKPKSIQRLANFVHFMFRAMPNTWQSRAARGSKKCTLESSSATITTRMTGN
mmetsp:Transcript_77402/g.219039  ORF Transcript_77402/g.219039 Transcript_77402/m.219039 type:complete len:235 (+) Transcript_77402:1316-2020(+)